jgi:predicted transcriptional regulator
MGDSVTPSCLIALGQRQIILYPCSLNTVASMTDDIASLPSLTTYVSQIVAAYASNNEVSAGELLDLIKTVHVALIGLGSPAAPTTDALVPAVPIKKSVFPDHLVCLEDGKSFKTLRRHLLTDHGMTPEQYRERWRLPASYPVVAPNYAATRSAVAKSNGFGRKAAALSSKVEADETGVADPLVRKIPAGKRGRKPKE